MTVGSEVSGDGIKDGEESLCLLRRFESSHPPLSLSRWLMRVLRAVIQISTLPMNNVRKHVPLRGTVASEFIGHNDPRFASSALKKLSKEALGRKPVSFGLNKNIDYGSVLIYCAPKIMLDAFNFKEYLIEMPL